MNKNISEHKFAPLQTCSHMSPVTRFLDSSIGRKVLMSLTGLFLCLFLIVHLSGNLQLFYDDMGLAFNQYTVWMTTFLPIKIISYLLYASVLIHVFNGIRLTMMNRAARPVNYSASKDPRSSTWASKNMAVLGIVVLIFLVTHMANFWFKYKFGDVPWTEYTVNMATGEVISKQEVVDAANFKPHEYVVAGADGSLVQMVVVRDLYKVVEEAFKVNWLVALYLIGLVALAYHLIHGFQSAFQTLGIRHTSYARLIQGIGIWLYGIIIPLMFAAMPVYFFLK